MPPSRTAERVRRLLAVVPYVVTHPGTLVQELTELFGVTEAELLADLDLLFVTGLPPYGPGDLVDVEVEEGRVWIRFAEHLSRPVRLTRSEALGLYLRGTELLGTTGVAEEEALRSALDKLARTLGTEALAGLSVAVGEGGGPAGPLDVVRAAAAGRDRVEIDYHSVRRDEVTTRKIDPEHVFSALGNWYVVAWCHLVKGERLFRLDRIRAVRDTGETFTPRGLAGKGRALYTPTEDDVRVRLHLGPGARWVAEYYPVEEVTPRSGGVEVTLPTNDLAWAAKLVLRLDGRATVLGPPDLAAQVRRMADATLARYRP